MANEDSTCIETPRRIDVERCPDSQDLKNWKLVQRDYLSEREVHQPYSDTSARAFAHVVAPRGSLFVAEPAIVPIAAIACLELPAHLTTTFAASTFATAFALPRLRALTRHVAGLTTIVAIAAFATTFAATAEATTAIATAAKAAATTIATAATTIAFAAAF